ncbi:Hsp20/alpha crystallin family protein [Niabella pedocola]|uniref:Hsp20/alpha crystallin family protein n=1 Tax=Niabella pedocola TaxID=1752077 RepID=A0ABS8PM12_9BACT|nr:Hsp20/alpha crystallin family protein [Niabella pedocola]MCD2422141.1 Hsp20/alpha crystallin family protein [Niabella pedocola]
MHRAHLFQKRNFIVRVIDRLILPWISWLRAKGVIGQTSVPSLNVAEEKDLYRIMVAAPGFQNEDLFFKTEHDELLISILGRGIRSTQKETVTGQNDQRDFSCSIRLPPEVSRHMIDAHMGEDALFIFLPKSPVKNRS